MSYTRLIVGNTTGTVLAELQADIEFINWRLNKVGRVKFNIAATDAKATETNLQYGNRVLVRFENGLPDWGGIIDPPRIWKNNILTITAYSAEQIFETRTTEKNKLFYQDTIGEMFETLITDANAAGSTGIQVGDVFYGGDAHSPDYHYKNLLAIFQESLTGRMSNYDFDVVGSLTGGQIQFTANLYESRGSNKTGLALVEGANLAEVELLEQGPIINVWRAAGEGTDWGSSRLTSYAADLDSIGLYGLREGSGVYSDVKEQATLDGHVETSLANTKDPTNIWGLVATNNPPAAFGDYDVGDTIALLAYSAGFGGADTTVRILAMEFEPNNGTLSLIVEEQF